MYLLLYNLFLWLYRVGMHIVAPWNQKAKLWLEGRKDLPVRMRLAFEREMQPIIWMHCASLGEFEQGRPLLEKLKLNYHSYKILLTFFSPSGYEVRKNYKGADYIFYLPMDGKKNAKILADIIKPKLVIWTKYDYWYYYLKEINERNIPLLLISAIFRKDHVFFKWYGVIQRKMLNYFSHFFVQTEGSFHLLEKIGLAKKVTVSGDTRFDRVIEIAEKFQSIHEVEKFCGKSKVIVAGSTWQEDEEELDHYANIHPEIKFIIAPHEIEGGLLKETEKLFHAGIRYSQLNHFSPDQNKYNVLIIDNIGMLSQLYKYATICFVGGGFGDDGVHNVLEAAVYGKPVVFGPVYDRYIEAVELVGSGGGYSVENALEAEELFNKLLNNKQEYRQSCEASKEFVYSNRGATDKIMRFIQENRLLTN